jgi:hypothetical protein
MSFVITANSTPVYDAWGPDDHWSCSDWITWHKALKKEFGADKANEIFISAFHKAGFAASSYDCRTFNSDFRKYAKDNGFYDALYDGITGLILKPIGSGNDVVNSASNTISNVGEGAEGITKTAVKAAKIVVISGVAALIIYGGVLIYKAYKA